MRQVCVALVVMLVGAACGSAEALEGKKKAAEESAIRQQMAAYAAARSNGDGALQASFYTEDADEWGSNDREMTVGRAAIAQKVGLPPDANRKMRLEPIRIDFLTPEIALVNCTYGGTAEKPTGKVLYVMVKTNGKWLIRSNRPSRFPVN